MMDRNVLVFDIETMADLTPDNREAVTALAAQRQVSPEDYGSLCPPLARVVCIGWYDLGAQKLGALFDASLCAGEWPRSVQVDAAAGDTRTCEIQECQHEAEMLRRFGHMVVQHLGQPNPQLVTFNGRGFDLPVLIHRAIKHHVTEGRELLLKAALESRYRPLRHLDLLDAVTFCGATGRWPMAAYAVGYGWRSPKQEMQGALVGPAVHEGRIIDVVRYCVGDVLATAHVYLCMNGGGLTAAEREPEAGYGV